MHHNLHVCNVLLNASCTQQPAVAGKSQCQVRYISLCMMPMSDPHPISCKIPFFEHTHLRSSTRTIHHAEEDGTRLYVSCLAFFEDVPAGVACQHRQAAGMRASRAMCLMSHQPYLTSMELSLRTLYASTFITGPTCAVPDSIAMLLRVPAPRPLAHTQHPGLSQPPTPGNRGSQGHVGASAGGAESPFAAAHATALHAHGNEGSQGGPEHGPHGAQQGAEEAAGAQGSGHSNSEGGAAKPQAVQVEFTLEGRPFRLLPPAPATGTRN